MALTYSLEPLRCRPQLIPACARMLQAEWGYCKADLLPQIVRQELGDAPCSLGLVEHRPHSPGGDTLVGHVRVVPVTDDPTAVYGESLCIAKAKRSQGLAWVLMQELDEYLQDLGYRYIAYASHKPWRESDVQKPMVQTLGANLLRTYNILGCWPGNTPAPGWEAEYEKGYVPEEINNMDGFGNWYMRDLTKNVDNK